MKERELDKERQEDMKFWMDRINHELKVDFYINNKPPPKDLITREKEFYG